MSNFLKKGAALAQHAYENAQKNGVMPPVHREIVLTALIQVAETAKTVKESAQNNPQAAAVVKAISNTTHSVIEFDTWNGMVQSALKLSDNAVWNAVVKIAQIIYKAARESPWAASSTVAAAIVAVYPGIVVYPVLHAIGFGPFGPTIGTVATHWQRSYHGFVPAGNLFSLAQQVAMGGGGPLMAGVSALAVLIVVGSITYMCLQDDKMKADVIAALEAIPKPWKPSQAQAVHEKARMATDIIFSTYQATCVGFTPVIKRLFDGAFTAVLEMRGYVSGPEKIKNGVSGEKNGGICYEKERRGGSGPEENKGEVGGEKNGGSERDGSGTEENKNRANDENNGSGPEENKDGVDGEKNGGIGRDGSGAEADSSTGVKRTSKL